MFKKTINGSDVRNKSIRSFKKLQNSKSESSQFLPRQKTLNSKLPSKQLNDSEYVDPGFQEPGHLKGPLVEDPLFSESREPVGPSPKETRLACIFKTNDDIRLDTLILQVMSVCKDIFDLEKSWLYLRVYNTFSNALDRDNLGGLIEVMLGTKSISEMINENEMNLTQCMLEFFDEQDPQFLKGVRENFIHSTAAYSLLTYVLQIKDR